MNICLFTPDQISKPIPKHDERAEHIVKVLHKKEGDSFDAGIIGGMSGTAKITHIGKKGESDEGEISFAFTPQGNGKPLYPLVLVVGFPRPIQLRRLLRDVAGLGVCAIHLTGTELGDKSYLKSSLVEKGAAYQMLLDGTAQAAGTHVPELFMHETFRECLDSIPAGGVRIALDNENPPESLHDYLAEKSEGLFSSDSKSPVVAAIGSERGWSDKERAVLENAGFTRCGMGIRILRTETAATVASSLILDALGLLS